MMKRFDSTLILCFLGFLFIQAKSQIVPCFTDSDCPATMEFCFEYPAGPALVNGTWVSKNCAKCGYFPSVQPGWCTDIVYVSLLYSGLTTASLLTFVEQGGYKNNMCPELSACEKNCRKEYRVSSFDRLNTRDLELASTFADTTDCVCDKLSFVYERNQVRYFKWLSASNSFGVGTTATSLYRNFGGYFNLAILKTNATGGYEMDCYWKYDSSYDSSYSLSSSATTLTCLFGVISASMVAFLLV